MDLGRYVHVVYRTRGAIVQDEVLCRRDYLNMALTGCFRVSDADRRRGQTIEVHTWRGEPRCSMCDETRQQADGYMERPA